MAIKWSAVELSEKMDNVERQLSLAEAFLAEAEKLAIEAKGINGLPQYALHPLETLIGHIRGRSELRTIIQGARDSIPKGAIEAEQRRNEQPGLGL